MDAIQMWNIIYLYVYKYNGAYANWHYLHLQLPYWPWFPSNSCVKRNTKEIQHPRAILAWENVFPNFKHKDNLFWETIFKMNFTFTRDTSPQTIQYKLVHRNITMKWIAKLYKIKENNICSYSKNKDTITHFLIYCTSNNIFCKSCEDDGTPWQISISKRKIMHTSLYFWHFHGTTIMPV